MNRARSANMSLKAKRRWLKQKNEEIEKERDNKIIQDHLQLKKLIRQQREQQQDAQLKEEDDLYRIKELETIKLCKADNHPHCPLLQSCPHGVDCALFNRISLF